MVKANETNASAAPQFAPAELELLAKTADALSAYLGKPILAEVALTDTGAQWVAFGMPLEASGADVDDETPHIQMGGPDAQILGDRGGLPQGTEVYDCLYLWAIELTDREGEKFVKLDQEGEEAAWYDDLTEVLPFAITDDAELMLAELSLDDEEDEDEEDDELAADADAGADESTGDGKREPGADEPAVPPLFPFGERPPGRRH